MKTVLRMVIIVYPSRESIVQASVLGVTERELYNEWIATVRTRTAAR